jgi:hypothetical protein
MAQEQRGEFLPDWAVAEELEGQVFIACEYVKDMAEHREEYKPYYLNSAFLISTPRNADTPPVGSSRTIVHQKYVGLKTLNDIKKGDLNLSKGGELLLEFVHPSQMLEVGTIGIRQEVQGTFTEAEALLQLYGGIAWRAQVLGKRYLLASFDQGYFEDFAEHFGPNCRELGSAKQYMGSLTLPVLMDAKKIFEYLRENSPKTGNKIARITAGLHELHNTKDNTPRAIQLHK